VTVTQPASAAVPCGSNPGSYFAGAQSPQAASTYGASGQIEIPNFIPALCTGATSFSDAWVMVTDLDRYAQIGFGKDYLTDGATTVNPRLISFAQYYDIGHNPVTHVFPAPTLGSTVTYRNALRSDDNHIHMLA